MSWNPLPPRPDELQCYCWGKEGSGTSGGGKSGIVAEILWLWS